MTRICITPLLCRYCDPVEAGSGVVVPVDCPAGAYCPENTTASHEFPCPAGTFSNVTNIQTAAECEQCTGGYFCEVPGKQNYAFRFPGIDLTFQDL